MQIYVVLCMLEVTYSLVEASSWWIVVVHGTHFDK